MKFGVTSVLGPSAIGDPFFFADQIVEQAVWAERYGWESYLFGEHHGIQTYLPNPFMGAMYIAAKTNRIKVGTFLALAPLYNPIRLAENIAVLDVLSKGRAEIALGMGYQPHDFLPFNLPIKQRVSRLEESVEIVKRAFKGEKFNFSGRRYQINDFDLQPKPLQEGGPPIYLGAWSVPGARRAARISDGISLAPVPKLSTNKALVNEYIRAARQAGKEPYIVASLEGWLARDKDTAVKEVGKYLLPPFVYFWEAGGIQDLPPNIKTKDQITWEVMAEDRWVFGSIDDGIAMIERLQKEFQAKELIMVLQQGDGKPPQRMVLEQMKLWGEKVIPYFDRASR